MTAQIFSQALVGVDSLRPGLPPSVFQAGIDVAIDQSYELKPSWRSQLYGKGKSLQWDAMNRIDWSETLDPENPLCYADVFLPVYGTKNWAKLSKQDQAQVRQHYQAYTVSQFLHGEQAAMLAAGRLIEVLPELSAKNFAAQQAADEARHAEVFSHLLHNKIGIFYDFDDGISSLIRWGLSDRRWDFVVLTTQVLLEGLALGMLQQLRDFSKSPLIQNIASYVMADEARHVAFGLQELEQFYPQLTAVELRERAEFAQEGLQALRRRFNPNVAWRNLRMEVPLEMSDSPPISLEQTISRLTRRLDTMLIKLGLVDGEGSAAASERLAHWHSADESLNQNNPGALKPAVS